MKRLLSLLLSLCLLLAALPAAGEETALLDEVLTDIETAGPGGLPAAEMLNWLLTMRDELSKDPVEMIVDASKALHFNYSQQQWLSTGHNRALLVCCLMPEGMEQLGLRDDFYWVVSMDNEVDILQIGANGALALYWQPGAEAAGGMWEIIDTGDMTYQQIDEMLRENNDGIDIYHVEADDLARARETYRQTFGGAFSVGEVPFEISGDRQSIFIDRPAITGGSGSYTVAYNIYDSNSQPVNYFYSDEKRVAATPGYGGIFNVFVVVTDRQTGESITRNIGWQELDWPRANTLTVGEVQYEISPDGRSIFLNRPAVACASGKATVAYNIYDADGNPVNYFYSSLPRVAATPGYEGRFNVFVVVTDTVTGESSTQQTGWHELAGASGR
ncbi:MAG: hypothetical protein IKP40_02845 [Clostridia bacterium]|nr:hypothetical protein [Clostridia bacterium]